MSRSTNNGRQRKMLGRELKRAEKLADRLDRVLALRDQELGMTADGVRGSQKDANLEKNGVRGSGFGVRPEERGSGFGVRGSQKDTNPEFFSAKPETRISLLLRTTNPEPRTPVLHR